MAWSIFDETGGPAAAEAWAEDLLDLIHAPQTAGNVQMVYDWERHEGGGGKYNPLNQGPVPGHPELTTTGQQYGGGAADFASWAAGLTGAVDYLNMPAYRGVLAGLLHNDPASARAALVASPWASGHYGGHLTDAALPYPITDPAVTGSFVRTGGGDPGRANPEDPVTGAAKAAAGAAGAVAAALDPFSLVDKALGGARTVLLTAALVVVGGGLVAAGAWRTVSPSVRQGAQDASNLAGAAAVIA